jgi:cytochrome P450
MLSCVSALRGILCPQDLFLTLLFAGHDTSASTIMRLFSEIPRHPDVWEKLVEEQKKVRPPYACFA